MAETCPPSAVPDDQDPAPADTSDELGRLRAELAQSRADHRQALRRLHERDALLKGLSQNIPGVLFKVVIAADGEAQLHYISEKAAELYELDAQAAHLNWSAHYARIHPDDVERIKALSRTEATVDGRQLHYEYRVILPSKGLRWMAGQTVSLREGEAGDIAWYGYISDITEQKLYGEAVISAQAADRANLAKSEFLSRMSHELRTPLNAVIGFAQLLQMDRGHVFGDEQRRRVSLIEKAGQHLLSMLGDVLDLSRIEAGGLPLSIESLDVTMVTDEAVQLVSAQARGKQIVIDTQGVDPHAYACGDLVRLRQVLVNLLSNAIKYNRQGGHVAVRAGRQGQHVFVEVQDTGIGMSEGQLAQLYEPFNRLGVEHSGIEGTGIGLVIVQRLITLMGGTVEVDSQVGLGSCFRLCLPAADETPLPSDHVPLDEAGLSTRPATILYAEDNEVNVALVHQVIKLRPHWRLLVAMNGQRALQLARRTLPDLMLVDMHLGDMNGFDLAAELDLDELTSRIPRVALSADAMPDRIHAARQRGFKAYLTKPLDVMALLRCLDEHLSGDSAHLPL